MPPTLPTLASLAREYEADGDYIPASTSSGTSRTALAREYEADGDYITAHQVAQALVTVWKAGQLDQPCLSCQAHDAATPPEQIKAARDLLNQAMWQMTDTQPD